MSRRKIRPADIVPARLILGRPQITGDLFPVRAIVGWLKPHFDAFYLAGSHRPAPPTSLLLQNEALLTEGRRLRLQLPLVDLDGAVLELPPVHAPYMARLLGDPLIRQKLAQGYEFRLFDLHRVCGLQPVISLPKSQAMAASLDLGDPLSIARLALPMTLAPALIVPSLSIQAPTMRVTNVFAPQGISPTSHLHVARLYGRHLLTDGYHRAYALLSAGIHLVPGFYKVAFSITELGLPPGLLPASLLTMPRPPLLTDFMIDGVSVELR